MNAGRKVYINNKSLDELPEEISEIVYGLSLEYGIQKFSMRPVGKTHTFITGPEERYWFVYPDHIDFKEVTDKFSETTFYPNFKFQLGDSGCNYVIVIFQRLRNNFQMQIFKLEDDLYKVPI